MDEIPVALTVAGSDSGGGAGIQADLKTFMALGVHGVTAITSITAQNTVAVTAIQDVSPDIVRAQIQAVVEDIGVDAAKTGMLHTTEIIDVTVKELERFDFPIVVDPVMISKSGSSLLLNEARETLIRHLMPIATVVTPNAMESEVLSGKRIETLEDAKKAAEVISTLGPKAVVVKGGHIIYKKDKAIDVLLFDGRFELLEADRHETRDTHGTGCSFSSAIAAFLAKGKDIPESVSLAKEFVNHAIRHGLRIGKGNGPMNPAADLYNEAEKYNVLMNLRAAIDVLESCPEIARLVAEVQMNIGMALPFASTVNDVAAIEGRIVKGGQGVRASGCPRFGASSHVARTIMAVMSFDKRKRAAVNLRYSDESVEALKGMGLVVSFYDRREEPPEVKAREGGTTYWGAGQAVERAGRVPDVIYHMGDWGKEPMITVVGVSAMEVADVVSRWAKKLAR